MQVVKKAKKAKEGRKNRKYDRCRNSKSHQRYVAENREERNRARRVAKHLRQHPNDKTKQGKVPVFPEQEKHEEHKPSLMHTIESLSHAPYYEVKAQGHTVEWAPNYKYA